MTLLVALSVLAVLALGYGAIVLVRQRRPRLPATFTVERGPGRLRDDVRFTVYRPASVEPERWYELLVFAHRAEGPAADGGWQPDLSDAVRAEAAKALGDVVSAYRTATEDAAHPIVRDTQLEFVPEIGGFQFNPPRIVLDWTEELHRAHFRMKAQSELLGTTARGQLTILNGPIIVAQLALVIRVAAEVADEPPERSVVTPYRRVFASYARTDTDVVHRLSEYARALGDEYLIDVTHIRAGEQWEPRIEQLIAQADVFQLFWSWNAIASEYVQREWRYALSLGRPNFVRPVYWEDPLPQAPERGLPPPELRSVHFQRMAIASPAAAPAPSPAAPPTATHTARLETRVPSSRDIRLPPSQRDSVTFGGAPPRRTRLPMATAAMLVLALGAVGVFTQLSQTGSSVGAPPDDATAVDPTDVSPPPPPPPPPPPLPTVNPDPVPTRPASAAITVAPFDAPADDAALVSLAADLRAAVIAAWDGPSIAAAPAGRDPVDAARAAGSRWVVSARLVRAADAIGIEARVLDIDTGEVRSVRPLTAPASAPASEIAALFGDLLRETISR